MRLEDDEETVEAALEAAGVALPATVTDAPGWGVEINPAWLDRARYRMSELS